MINFPTRSYLIFISLGLLAISRSTSQGLADGFYNGSKNFTIVLGAGSESNPTYLAGERKLELDKSFQNINVFVAYGITDKIDLNLAAAYVKSGDEKGFQDARILFKYKLYELELEKLQLSAQLASGFSFPLSDYQTEGRNAIGQRASSIPARILIHAKHSSGFFATAQTGYDYKFDPVSNAYASSLKLGFARSSYYVDVFLDYQNSIEGKDYRGNPAPNNFRELEVDFLRTGVTFFKPLSEKIGAFINGVYTIDGRNVGIGPAINLGIVYKSKF
ncbi:transporter [Nonlabens antarcticus]|uniref:transporter n=1 Tax=Nonlabens antarcticus TaxID=392714 RepID=UPI001890BE25|nr:transporter [Nonlabens antarcticus]